MKSVCIQSFLVCIFPYSVRMRENTDQKNSAYGHILRSDLSVPETLTYRFCTECLILLTFLSKITEFWKGSESGASHDPLTNSYVMYYINDAFYVFIFSLFYMFDKLIKNFFSRQKKILCHHVKWYIRPCVTEQLNWNSTSFKMSPICPMCHHVHCA